MSAFFGSMFFKVVSTQVGVAAALALLARLLPDKKLKAVGHSAGAALSKFGNSKWGAKVYEPVETFVQKSIVPVVDGFSEGLDYDETAEGGENAGAAAADTLPEEDKPQA